MKFGSSNSFMLYPSPKISPRTRRIGIYYRYNFCNWKTLPTLFQNTFVPFLCIFLWESFEKFDFLNFNPYGGPFGKASVFQVAVLNRKLMDTTNIPFSSHPLRVEFEEDERVNTFLPNLSHCQLMWQCEETRKSVTPQICQAKQATIWRLSHIHLKRAADEEMQVSTVI